MSIIDRAEPVPDRAPAMGSPTGTARPTSPAPFRKRFFGTGLRPGFLSYGLLLAFLRRRAD